MVTGSSVKRTALIICNASFFAPCGMISPFNFFPPFILNTIPKLLIVEKSTETRVALSLS